MSVVSEVLASVHCKGHIDVSINELEELVKKSEEVKINVVQKLTSRYIELSSALQDASSLQQKVSLTLNDLKLLQNRIEKEISSNIEACVGEVENVVKQWKEAEIGLEAASTLIDIHLLLDEANKAKINKNFITAAECLAEVEVKVKAATQNDIESQLEVIIALSEQLCAMKVELVYTIAEQWNETIAWEEETSSDGSKFIKFVCKVSKKDKENLVKLQEILPALHMLGELNKSMVTLGDNFMANVFRPVICNGAVVSILDYSSAYAFQVKTSNVPSKNDSNPIDVFKNLELIFLLLDATILGVSVDCDGEQTKLMKLFGQQIGSQFTEMLIKDCLVQAVPCSRQNLSEFDPIKVATHDFYQTLVQIGFYTEEEKSILNYAANINTIFSNKSCAHILEKAHELMRQPLHHTLYITEDPNTNQLIVEDEAGNKNDNSTMQLEKLLSAKSFSMPKCKISGSVSQLVDLIYETMEEACVSEPQYAGRLFYTVRNILTIYRHVVPTAHKHALSTLPQQAALLHNNCMYLAHHAFLLGLQYKTKLPKELRESSITAADLGQNLRSTAITVFLKALKNHKSHLVETLRETSCITSIDFDSKSVARAQQGINQCLHQLNLLHNVWQHVLPHTVFSKAMGTLISSVVEELLTRIVSLEDISTDAAFALIDILTQIKNNVPNLFQVEGEASTSPGDVIQKVRLWGKFCELIIILGASLKDILDRWADGKGPFAYEFTADEAKQLIRALFQNTDRRAEVLSKIK